MTNEINSAAALPSGNSAGIARLRDSLPSCSPAHLPPSPARKPQAGPSAIPAVPGPDAVRALLVLAAESGFELQDGVRDGASMTRLAEQGEILSQQLAALPEVHQGVDRSLMLRRARRSVVSLIQTIESEILDRTDQNTALDTLKDRLQAVKAQAVEAGRALVLLSAGAR